MNDGVNYRDEGKCVKESRQTRKVVSRVHSGRWKYNV